MAYSDIFWSILLGSFGLVLLLTGAFTSYFGAGRSRRIGLGLMLMGIVSLFLFAAFTFHFPRELPVNLRWETEEVLKGVVAVVASTAGMFLAFALFLVFIMRA